MSQDNALGSKVKAQISRFANRLTQTGYTQPKRRFVAQMLYGIQASEDVKLSNIARALNESIALIKTEDRLSRQLAQSDLTDRINNWLCWEGAGAVGPDTVLALDLGDVQKPYGKAMEYLAQVRDGSTGKIGPGYWLCEVLAAEPYSDSIVPLYGELYSQEAEDFQSENAQILKAIDRVSAATGKQGIITIDRGGDRYALLNPLIDDGLRFVIRQRGDRDILTAGDHKRTVKAGAQCCRMTQTREVEVERKGQRVKLTLRMGSMPVRLPSRPKAPLWLVVIHGFGEEPILLLTNVAPEHHRGHATWIADVYLTRWKCEEAYRFVKQSYQLEDVRVRSYTSLRNVYALVTAAFYFVSAVLGRRIKLKVLFERVCDHAQRFYEIATFFHYAVADGIHRLLFASPTGPHLPAAPVESAQQALPFGTPDG